VARSHLSHLVWLALSTDIQDVDDLLDSLPGEDVVATANALVESQVLQHIHRLFERDIRVRLSTDDPVVAFRLLPMRAQPTLCSLRTSRSGRQSPASDLTAPPPRDAWSIAVTDRKRTTNHGPTLAGKRAWQDSNLRHTAPETVALSPELQARARAGTAQGCYRNVCGASTDGRGD
jgi:hypothetical protein